MHWPVTAKPLQQLDLLLSGQNDIKWTLNFLYELCTQCWHEILIIKESHWGQLEWCSQRKAATWLSVSGTRQSKLLEQLSTPTSRSWSHQRTAWSLDWRLSSWMLPWRTTNCSPARRRAAERTLRWSIFDRSLLSLPLKLCSSPWCCVPLVTRL